MTLREDLADWQDWDEAAYAYGRALGIFDGANRRQVSRVLLSDNPLGNGLHAGMMALVEAGAVERREEPEEQFRWVYGYVSDTFGNVAPVSAVPLPGQDGPDAPAPEDWLPPKRWWKRHY